MKSSINFVLAFLWGLALHQTSSITRKMPQGYQEIIGTGIGVVGTAPVALVAWRSLDGIKDHDARFLAGYFGGFLPIGAGVVAGWLIDTIWGVDRTK